MKYLRGELRRLEKENKSLRRENNYYKKHAHQYEESQYDDDEDTQEIEVIKNGVSCGECGKGVMREFEIMPGKVFRTCPICDHREKVG